MKEFHPDPEINRRQNIIVEYCFGHEEIEARLRKVIEEPENIDDLLEIAEDRAVHEEYYEEDKKSITREVQKGLKYLRKTKPLFRKAIKAAVDDLEKRLLNAAEMTEHRKEEASVRDLEERADNAVKKYAQVSKFRKSEVLEGYARFIEETERLEGLTKKFAAEFYTGSPDKKLLAQQIHDVLFPKYQKLLMKKTSTLQHKSRRTRLVEKLMIDSKYLLENFDAINNRYKELKTEIALQKTRTYRVFDDDSALNVLEAKVAVPSRGRHDSFFHIDMLAQERDRGYKHEYGRLERGKEEARQYIKKAKEDMTKRIKTSEKKDIEGIRLEIYSRKKLFSGYASEILGQLDARERYIRNNEETTQKDGQRVHEEKMAKSYAEIQSEKRKEEEVKLEASRLENETKKLLAEQEKLTWTARERYARMLRDTQQQELQANRTIVLPAPANPIPKPRPYISVRVEKETPRYNTYIELTHIQAELNPPGYQLVDILTGPGNITENFYKGAEIIAKNLDDHSIKKVQDVIVYGLANGMLAKKLETGELKPDAVDAILATRNINANAA